MPDIITILLSFIVAVLYFEYGKLWLRMIAVTDTTNFATGFIDNMKGDGTPDEVWSARVVAASVILGWPAFMLFGRINGWLADRKEISGE